MNRPVKSYSTIEEQLAVFRERGMSFRKSQASQWLENVSYYRLSAYSYPYRTHSPHPDQPRLDDFVRGTRFADVVQLYEFDRKLRTLIHDGVERIEVALRTQLGEVIGAIDPLAYKDASNFRPTFKHNDWLKTANGRVKRLRAQSASIQHHDREYGGELPIWVLTDLLDFADCSKLYDGLYSRDQWIIARKLGLEIDVAKLSQSQREAVKKHHPLARWFEQLTIVRNTTAHHGRVWNQSFTPTNTSGLKTLQIFSSLPDGQSERIYGALAVMTVLLNEISPGNTWAQKVRSLVEGSFQTLKFRNTSEMGFPKGWEHEEIWKSSQAEQPIVSKNGSAFGHCQFLRRLRN